jgi:hypothetical protein
VAFCAVEAADEDDLEDVVDRAVADIAKTASQLDVTRIMVYPYAHLASDLATAGAAIEALDGVSRGLNDLGLEVKRAPFGWYKAFTLTCKGHPLSELSRTIVAGGEKEEAVAKKEVEHEWFVLTPDGKREDVEKYMDESPFGCLVKKELGVPAAAGGEPPHVELMRSQNRFDGVEWDLRFAEANPELRADPGQLQQVFINLISNAVKFTDEGSVTCRARYEFGEIMVNIIDTGVGIAKEDCSKVFEKFVQVGNTLTEKPKGSGLGLTISKQIVEHHGGRIWMDSELGKGTTFTVILPIECPETAKVPLVPLT